MISIHAPRAGRDDATGKVSNKMAEFQSTRPVRGATYVDWTGKRKKKFQSTRPVRGATHPARRLHPRRNISIHAPRAGRDFDLGISETASDYGISIHAPRAGRDSKSIQNYFTHFCDKRQFLDNFTQNAAF